MKMARGGAHVLLVLLGGAGLWISHKLSESHTIFLAGGVSQGLFCGDTGVFDCHQVAAHESSWLWGVPLPYWGAMYFVTVVGLAAAAALFRGGERKAFLALGAVACGLALLFDAYLAWVMVVRIGSICLNCVATYAVNLLLFAGFLWLARGVSEPLRWRRALPSWRGLGRGSDEEHYGALLKLLLAGLLVTWGAATWRWRMEPLEKVLRTAGVQAEEFARRIRSDQPPDVDMALLGRQPFTGPRDAPVHVAVFGDFQCTFCRSMARVLEGFQERSDGRIRLTFVNTPNDHACNDRLNPSSRGTAHACWLAAGAHCALDQGRFWEYHALLYHGLLLKDVAPQRVLEVVAGAGIDRAAFEACVASPEAVERVRAELDLAAACGVTSSPALVINGYRRDGTILPGALESVLSALLERESSSR